MPSESRIIEKRKLQAEKQAAKKDKKKSRPVAADRNDITAYIALREGLIDGDKEDLS